MANIAIFWVYILLALLGIAYFTKFIILKFFNIDKNCTSITIIPLRGHNENVEYVVRKEIAKIEWKSFSPYSEIICLDCGMDRETRKICDLLCSDYSFIKLQDLKHLVECERN